MQVERTFPVPRSAAEVFGRLRDFESTNHWDPGTVETRRTSGDGGVGTTYANTSTFMDRQVELTYTAVTVETDRHLVFRGVNEQCTATDDLSFRALSETETEIHYRATFAFHSWLKLVAPLVLRRRLDPLADETVERMRAWLLS